MKVLAKTLKDNGLEATYSGYWRNPRKRAKVLNKPRHYKFTIHVFDILGDCQVIDIDPLEQKLSKNELSQLIRKYLNEYVFTREDTLIDMTKTAIVIRTKQQF